MEVLGVPKAHTNISSLIFLSFTMDHVGMPFDILPLSGCSAEIIVAISANSTFLKDFNAEMIIGPVQNFVRCRNLYVYIALLFEQLNIQYECFRLQ